MLHLQGKSSSIVKTLTPQVFLKGEAESKRLAFRQKGEEVQGSWRRRSLPSSLLGILNKIKFKLKPCNGRAGRGQGEADDNRVKPGLKRNKAVIWACLWDS